MDGVIIDSEPLWREAEIEAFATVGIPLTEALCRETMGLRVDEVVEHWFHRFSVGAEKGKVVEEHIWENVIRLVKGRGEAKEGVRGSLDFFRGKGVRLALASTSAMALINTVLDKLALRSYFEELHSAEFEPYGKPHPGVYISMAKRLGVPAHTCLAIEDSINGILAAKAAKMKCVAIPEKELAGDKRLGIADAVVGSLTEINDGLWETLS